MKLIKYTAIAFAVMLSGVANAASIVGIYSGNDGDADQLEALLDNGVELLEVGRVNWVFDGTSVQSDGVLTITGTDEKGGEDVGEYIAGTWETDGSVDYITFKFDGVVAILDTMGDTFGSWSTADLCTQTDLCNSGKVWALSHSAAYTVVPVPAAAYLFASGLIGMIAVSRRRLDV